MALSESMAAYEDCFELFDMARSNSRGIRVEITEGDTPTERQRRAGMMRMRMNQARVLQRREAMRQYERTDPRYGKSENDKFRVTCREDTEGNWWIYIEVWNMAVGVIEPLGDDLLVAQRPTKSGELHDEI